MRAAHRRIYKKIPAFTCKEGCTDCCGPVPMTEYEANRLELAEQITPFKPGTMDCSFICEGKCSVYDKRPYLCRVFGVVDSGRLKCPHGYKPKAPMSPNDLQNLTSEYMALMRK